MEGVESGELGSGYPSGGWITHTHTHTHTHNAEKMVGVD